MSWGEPPEQPGWVRPSVLHSALDPTRARPEPWFVGSGRGLMILVLSLCAVLLVVRGVTIVWMAEAAWEWLQRHAPGRSSIAPPSIAASLPDPPPAPANVEDRPRTTALGNPAVAFDRDSYPVEALRRGEEGRVVARLAIDGDGRPTGCSVVTSSRSRSLDRATCAIGVAKVRFRSPRGTDGRPLPSRYDLKVRWSLKD